MDATGAGTVTAFGQAATRVAGGEDPHAVAAELVAQMTVDEKLGCLDGDTPFWTGLVDMVTGGGYHAHTWPAGRVERLGIPGIEFSDGPRGVVIDQATCFPVSMARGATWDPDLEERIGDAIGRELRAVGATLFGGVCVNLLRHPAWGRAQETYGEDPLLVGEMGAALARGVQRHAMACVKHFACNSIENARFKVDVEAGERALHEVYLPHFKRVVDDGVASVMSAYNSLNGSWCGENGALLTTILRDEWGFDGFVISDFIFGLRDPVASVAAGLDVEMPFAQQRHEALPVALADGSLAEADVDRAVARILATVLRFADRTEATRPSRDVLAAPDHRALAREAATRSIVLLRNEPVDGMPVLPLDPASLRRLAVIGRLAAEPNLGDHGSSQVLPPAVVTPLGGLRAALEDRGVEVVHDDGTDLPAAAVVAGGADAVVVVAGYTHHDEGEYIEPGGNAELVALFPKRAESPARRAPSAPAPAEAPAEAPPPAAAEPPGADGGFGTGGDRRSLTLHERDEALVHAVAAANPRTVVAVMSGSAVLVESWHDGVASIVQLWYPGMEGGHALADVLLGRSEPGGRLPFAVPTDAAHLPHFDPDARTITYDLWHGQWLLDRDGREPRFPFGFGLSYSRTSIAGATARLDGDTIVVEATIRNEGDRPAPEVVQVYAGLPSSKYERPARRLAGFARTEPGPGQQSAVRITVPLDRLAVRVGGGWLVEDGDYEVVVARHARDPEARSVVVSVTKE